MVEGGLFYLDKSVNVGFAAYQMGSPPSALALGGSKPNPTSARRVLCDS